MHVFWRHGYETTSLSQLTDAMRVSAPSVYAAFGDKKGLFQEAVRRYASVDPTAEQVIDGAPTAREAARRLLETSAVGFTGEETPPGCLLATAAITGSPEAADVRADLAAIRRRIEGALRMRIERAIRAGELPANSDADALAGFTMATIQGMSTLARDGASRGRLLRIAQTSLRAWP